MSNTKHTPGPWAVAAENFIKHAAFVFADTEEEKIICKMCFGGASASEPELKEARANAKLIAAAPEMLEALKEVSKLINSTYGIEGHVAGVARSWEKTGIDKMIRDVIAKAEGEPV